MKTLEDRNWPKKCSMIYGNGVHLMRILASTIVKEDYRVYDMDCHPSANMQQDQIHIRESVSPLNLNVVPNPNNGNFLISISEPEKVRTVLVADIQGNVYLELPDVKSMNPVIITKSGLYNVIAFNKDGTTATTKCIIFD